MGMLKSSEGQVYVEQSLKPIVWALDPLDKERKRLKLAAQAISMWKGSAQAKILPVGALTPSDLGWPPEMFPLLDKEMGRIARRNLTNFIKISKIRDVSNVDLVITHGTSVKSGAQSIADFATWPISSCGAGQFLQSEPPERQRRVV
jgi:hypothetical protein